MSAARSGVEIVRAAGAVLWRPPGEVAIVHRPRYDDWSLPKGKLHADELDVVAALREVREETGHDAVVGRPLGVQHYEAFGLPKVVRYWAMRAVDGEFRPHAEVDALRWLPLPTAAEALSYDRDRQLLDAFAAAAAAGTADTAAVVLVRHAHAGKRSEWRGDDRVRPLDERGLAQAQRLAPALAAYRPQRLLAADVLRCEQTLAPLASLVERSVEATPALAEDACPQTARMLVGRLLAAAEPVVACGQRGLAERILPLPAEGADGREGFGDRAGAGKFRKAAAIVLHVPRAGSNGGDDPAPVAVERVPPPESWG